MSAALDDPALETLFLPFDEGRLTLPADGTLFLRARGGVALRQRSVPHLVCEQSFRPEAEALERAGVVVTGLPEESSRRFALALLLPPRQRDESRASMARAVAALKPGGVIVASATNNEGARSAQSDLESLAGPLEVMTKNHCRVFWTAPLQGPVDTALAAQWARLDAIRPILDGRFVSRPGVFAWDRIDPASQLLAESLPRDLKGEAADLGSGFGFLSVELLNRCSGISALDAYEAEARALELTKRNLASFAGRAALKYEWHDVTVGLPRSYDVIVTNPPFHANARADRHDIGRRFIAVAAQSLRPGGSLWLVANRHLPYEQTLAANFAGVRTVAARDGFKVIAASKAPRI